MTFLDYFMEKKQQMENNSPEWQEYKSKCILHFEENENEFRNFFADEDTSFVQFNELEETPFTNIPKFLAIVPFIGSLECYFKAVGFEFEYYNPNPNMFPNPFAGYKVKNPF